MAMQAAGQPDDVVTVIAELRRLGMLEDVGGDPFVRT